MTTINFRCSCGKTEHEETIENGERVIKCSQCGEVYYTGSSLREIEQTKKEQSATIEAQ